MGEPITRDAVIDLMECAVTRRSGSAVTAVSEGREEERDQGQPDGRVQDDRQAAERRCNLPRTMRIEGDFIIGERLHWPVHRIR
jgi:hypothetical protein